MPSSEPRTLHCQKILGSHSDVVRDKRSNISVRKGKREGSATSKPGLSKPLLLLCITALASFLKAWKEHEPDLQAFSTLGEKEQSFFAKEPRTTSGIIGKDTNQFTDFEIEELKPRSSLNV